MDIKVTCGDVTVTPAETAEIVAVSEQITIFVRPCARAPKLKNDKFKLDKKITVSPQQFPLLVIYSL